MDCLDIVSLSFSVDPASFSADLPGSVSLPGSVPPPFSVEVPGCVPIKFSPSSYPKNPNKSVKVYSF